MVIFFRIPVTSWSILLLLLSHFSRVWLCDPIDGLLPGSSVPGILQARTLEWVVNSFSNAWKWKVKVKSLSRVRLLATSWTAAYQASPSMGFSRQEYWSGVPLPSPETTRGTFKSTEIWVPLLRSLMWLISGVAPGIRFSNPDPHPEWALANPRLRTAAFFFFQLKYSWCTIVYVTGVQYSES